MSKSFSLLCAFALFSAPAFSDTEQSSELQLEKKIVRKSPTIKPAFSPFTGKIKGEKVRVRLQPDLDGHIVKELKEQDLVAVTDYEGDYWCITAPEGIHAYVFRSFILDDVVEGSRVNVRLEPDLEAPVIAHLNTGDPIEGEISPANKKWLEIDPPKQARFYIAKEFIQNVGGPEYKIQMEKRKIAVQSQIDQAQELVTAATRAPFEEINFDKLKESFQTVVNNYADFTDKVLLAKEGLVAVQELYLNKRIAYLEARASVASASMDKIENANKPIQSGHRLALWEPLEEALYLSWARSHEERGLDEYYDEERLSATHLSGALEAFISPVKNKPGDYVLKEENHPVAYLYSTKIDLGEYVGKKVTLIGSERPSNHFAFPTYFVHNIE
ncbi:MAG: hypothetical protein K940chlam2_00564 [Chlamydiae bacterium]|nr:hypothetical protein [Chlamydiota bacterium]